jgi:putative addiction module component (TIGR02574 family)
MNQELVAEILALPASERVRLVDAIWDSIAEAPDALELTQWQRDELDSRLAEFEADPDSGATLEEVFARIRRASRLDGLLLGPEPSATSGLRQPSTPNSQTLKHEP